MKVKRNRSNKRALLLAVCLLSTLAGCQLLPEQLGGPPRTDPQPDPYVSGQADWERPESLAVNDFPRTFLRRAGVKSGQLSCTIQGIEVLENVSGLPEGNFETWPTVEVLDEEGQRMILEYPDFISENGQLLPGLYLVLAELTVTSQGAQSYTRRDRDALGTSLGEFDDPYVFRADRLLGLQELAGETQSDCALGYFSARAQQGEHRLAYRLEDGERQSFTLGFWVHDLQQGGNVSLEDLYLVVYEGALTRLDLKGIGGGGT
ncbi:MAG TPA: hypothetical protein IAC21_04175 [Candidatus Enterenecus merdae]|nr:hypothetical protein [Candidatus Enterenecus merdae]